MAVAPPHYNTETDSAAALDGILAHLDLFTVYAEVPGTLIQPRPGQVNRSVRIDRLLTPNDKLLGLGWRHGIIGIEIKRTDTKLGPALAQAMDYTRAVWTLPGSNFSVVAGWVFVFCFDKQHGDMASVMAQSRVGTASTDQWTALHLAAGEASLLRASWSGDLRLGVGANGVERELGGHYRDQLHESVHSEHYDYFVQHIGWDGDVNTGRLGAHGLRRGGGQFPVCRPL